MHHPFFTNIMSLVAHYGHLPLTQQRTEPSLFFSESPTAIFAPLSVCVFFFAYHLSLRSTALRGYQCDKQRQPV